MVVATNPPYGLMVAFMQGTYTILLIILLLRSLILQGMDFSCDCRLADQRTS